MKVNSFTDVLGGVVLVALVTTVVTSKNTAGQVSAAANGFANILAAALGKGSAR